MSYYLINLIPNYNREKKFSQNCSHWPWSRLLKKDASYCCLFKKGTPLPLLLKSCICGTPYVESRRTAFPIQTALLEFLILQFFLILIITFSHGIFQVLSFQFFQAFLLLTFFQLIPALLSLKRKKEIDFVIYY